MAGSRKRKPGKDRNSAIKEKIPARGQESTLDNEGKQTNSDQNEDKKSKGGEYRTPKLNKRSAKNKNTTLREKSLDEKNFKSRKIIAEFTEDDEHVTMEVDEQEFADEEGTTDMIDTDSSEDEDEREVDFNNNATSAWRPKSTVKRVETACRNDCDSEADTVVDPIPDVCRSLPMGDQIDENEIAVFERWERYMKWKRQKEEEEMAKMKPPERFGEKSRQSNKGKTNNLANERVTELCSPSEITIYKEAVEKEKRISSSSEYDTSDDNMEVLINEFVGKQRMEEEQRQSREDKGREDHRSGRNSRYVEDGEVPHSSRQQNPREEGQRFQERIDPMRALEEKAEHRIRQAEKGKARLYETPGNTNTKCTATIDETFMLLAPLLDDHLKSKIADGRYVDFAKLLVKDRIAIEEDNRMEWIPNKEGGGYYVPVSDREVSAITGIHRW